MPKRRSNPDGGVGNVTASRMRSRSPRSTAGITVGTVLAAALFLASAAWAQSECSATAKAAAEQAYSTAYQFVSNNQWNDAVPSLKEALAACPTHWPSVELMAGALMRQKNYDEAAKYYGQLVAGQYGGKLPAVDMRVLKPYGFVLLQTQQWDKADEVYHAILLLDPYNYDAHDKLRYRYEKTGDTAKAIEHLLKMYEFADESNKEAVAKQLGDAYKRLGDNDAAAEWYAQGGGATTGMFKIGVDEMKAKNWQKAVEAFNTYLEGRPKSVPALKNLGQCYQALKQTSDAIDTFQKALAIDPKRYDVAASLGFLYDETQQWAKAGELAQNAIDNWPRDEDKLLSMYYLMGRVREKRDQDYEGAIEMFQKALSDPYWGKFARDEIKRQEQFIQIREMKSEQGR
jgi:tetratricopeptide (TPR) repeat protein